MAFPVQHHKVRILLKSFIRMIGRALMTKERGLKVQLPLRRENAAF